MSEKKFRQLRTSKVNNMPATIKRIFSFMFKYKIKTVIILLCIVIAALTNVASSYFITPVIDEYVTRLKKGISNNTIFSALLWKSLTFSLVALNFNFS